MGSIEEAISLAEHDPHMFAALVWANSGGPIADALGNIT